MKKKILSLGVIAILLIMLICLTGCGEVKDGQGTNKTSKNSLVSVAKVGDYVDYKTQAGSKYTATKENTGSQKEQIFETTGEEKWRVLSINDDGTVDLISEEGMSTKFEKEFELKGETGFLNGIQELNNIANLYANGEYAISGRSMEMYDIIDLIGIDNIANIIEKRYEKDLSSYVENEKLEEICKLKNKNYGKTCTINGITHTINDGLDMKSSPGNKYGIEDACTDQTIQNLLEVQYNENQQGNVRCSIWLADELYDCGGYNGAEDYFICSLGYYSMSDYSSHMGSYPLCDIGKNGGYSVSGKFVRPVVTLEKDLKVDGGDGTKENPFILK